MKIIQNYKRKKERKKRKLFVSGKKQNLFPNSEAIFKSNKKNVINFSEFFHIDEKDYSPLFMLNTFSKLNKLLNTDLRYYSSIFDYINDIGVQKIKNKAKVFSDLDRFFYRTLQYGWQETFKYKEFRKNKKIIMIDVNSMYPFTMTQNNFTEINNMKIEYNPKTLSKFSNGIALVDFEITSNWFQEIFPRYHYVEEIRYYENKRIFKDVWMHISELNAYSKYIKINKIEKVVYSKNSTEHYLSNSIKFFYKMRKSLEKKSIEEKIIKNILVGLHSVTNKNQMSIFSKKFKNKYELFDYLKKYNIHIDNLEDIFNIDNQIFKTYDLIIEKNGFLELKYYKQNKYNKSIINSLSSNIYANSRIVLFKVIEFLEKKGIEYELAYINIDSIHFIVNEKDEKSVVNELKKAGYIGSELGQWKLEEVAEKGLWFEPGRYWTFDSKFKLKKAANIVIFNGDEESYFDLFRDIETVGKYDLIEKRRHYVFYGFLNKNLVKNNWIRVDKLNIEDRLRIIKQKKYDFFRISKKNNY